MGEGLGEGNRHESLCPASPARERLRPKVALSADIELDEGSAPLFRLVRSKPTACGRGRLLVSCSKIASEGANNLAEILHR